MLVQKRVAHIQLLARQLRRVAVEQSVLHAAAAPHRDGCDVDRGSALVLRRGRTQDVHSRVRRLEAIQNRLLCRRVPVALSLLERSLSWQVRKGETGTTAGAATASMTNNWVTHRDMQDTPTAKVSSAVPANRLCVTVRQTQSILRALHLFERHRRLAYGAAVGRQRNRMRTVAQRGNGSRASTMTAATDDHDATTAETQVAARQLQLFAQSLLARPYLSARLWRLLLRESVWTGAVQLQRQLINMLPPHSSSVADAKASSSEQLLLLLTMCLAFSRLTLGVLHDYVVHGVQVNRVSPRFAVSVPSAAWEAARRQRRRSAPSEAVTDTAPASHDGPVTPTTAADQLFDMLGDGSREGVARGWASLVRTVSRRDRAVAGRGNTSSDLRALRWLPPAAEDVVPLVVNTLALHSFLVPELPVRALVQASKAGELLSLLVTLQKMATVTLTLQNNTTQRGRTSGKVTTSVPVEGDQADTALHTVLRRLEQALLAAGCGVKDALVEQITGCTGDAVADGASTFMRSVTPMVAARLVLDLDALHLLHPDERRSRSLLDALLLVLFPEMRTGTADALVQKSRQSSLLAYATRGHRRKLRRQFGGDEARTTRYLLNTIVQQARLQQRMMATALRERFVAARHTSTVAELGRGVPLYDLVSLFQIFVSSASSTATAVRAASTSRHVTAALFVAEAMLLSGLLQPSQGTRSSREDGTATLDAATRAALPDATPQLGLDFLARLWPSLAVLWTVVDARRAALPSSDRTEAVLLRALTELVLHGINAALAERLRGVTSAGLVGPNAKDAIEAEASLQDLMSVAAGMQEWLSALPSVRAIDAVSGAAVRCGRPHDLVEQVRRAARLLRELLLHDRALWRQVRACNLNTRLRLMQQFDECLQRAGVLDQTTHSALQRICSAV